MKSRMMFILLMLLLGAIVNVAVAWGCGLRSPMTIRNQPGYAMSTSGAETRVFDSSEFFLRSGEPGFISQYDLFGWEWRGRGARMLRISHWIGYNAAPWDTGDYLIERESGWPLLSMHGQCREINTMYWAFPVPSEWRKGPNFIGIGAAANQTAGVFLPLRPLWPGFLINTVFYALLLWLLFFAPFAARRALRRKRRLCEKCAYPVGTSPVCTECGAGVPGGGESGGSGFTAARRVILTP